MNEKYNVIAPISVEIEHVTLPRFEGRAFLALIVEVFLKDLEVQYALPLFAFCIKGKKFQKMPSSVNAEKIKFAIVIEVSPINRRMLDLRKIGQVARFDLQLEPSSALSHDLKGTVTENQQRMGVSG